MLVALAGRLDQHLSPFNGSILDFRRSSISEVGFEHHDLDVMSVTSFHCSTPSTPERLRSVFLTLKVSRPSH